MPSNRTRVRLVNRRGGNGDDFSNTIFDDSAETAIGEASAPFAGSFRPEEPLEILENQQANGRWLLEINDEAAQDGGSLRAWRLEIQTECAHARIESDFNIELQFMGGLTIAQRAAFEFATARWSEIITGDLPNVSLNGRDIDDVLILAEGKPIDGTGRILGQAGPTHVRTGSNLPIRGTMSFDTADLSNMEANGSLVDVIVHEMGHVLGIGTLWERMKLISGKGTNNPEFNGTAAAPTIMLSSGGTRAKVRWTDAGIDKEQSFSGEFLIGRDPACDVHVNNGAVSRRHARVFYIGNQWFIEDLKSQNGTLIDEGRIDKQPLDSHTEVCLSDDGPVVLIDIKSMVENSTAESN